MFKTPVLETSKKINGLQQGFEYETKGYTCVCVCLCVCMCVCVCVKEREKVKMSDRKSRKMDNVSFRVQ